MKEFLSNLKYLTDMYTQKVVAEKTGFSTSSIANYLSGKSQPSALFLIQLKKAFKIDIDQFLTIPLDKESFNNEHKLNYTRFFGNYIVYYYNSSAYKGKIGSYNYEILTYGIISVCDDIDFTSPKGIKVNGLFMLSRKEAENILQTLNSYDGDVDKINDFYAQYSNRYWGNLTQNETQLFISLKNNNDKCMIILNNPPSTKKYLGGLGTVNSISRGREHVPCVQYILISQTALAIADGEIYNMLSLDLPDINIKNEVNDLVELIKTLYVSQTETGLNEYQQKRIIEDSITNIISSQIDANMFRFAKVTNMEDDNYYRLLKEASDDWLPKNIWWYGSKVKPKKQRRYCKCYQSL